MKKIFLSLVILFAAVAAHAQDLSLFKKEWFIRGTDTLPYRILLPENFNPKKKYPVVYFLHGAGERGNDNESQLTHGAALFLRDSIRKNYPAIVIFPQCPAASFWSNVRFQLDSVTKKHSFLFDATQPPSIAMSLLLGLTQQVDKTYKLDKKRVYVAGLSMGGMGTFEIVNRRKGYFTAAMPICGGGDPSTAKSLAKIPWWIFHGAKDDVVLPQYSEEMVAALKQAGAKVNFTLYPSANHNSWDPAFAEPDFLHWLFAQKK
ncbi:MAG: prolyl oligopeptidase family serine peptidase [Ferruginibacter sp.]